MFDTLDFSENEMENIAKNNVNQLVYLLSTDRCSSVMITYGMEILSEFNPKESDFLELCIKYLNGNSLEKEGVLYAIEKFYKKSVNFPLILIKKINDIYINDSNKWISQLCKDLLLSQETNEFIKMFDLSR